MPAPSAAPPPSEAAKTRFVLKSVVIDGSTVYQTGDLAGLYSRLLGREVSLLDIYTLRDSITTKYRADGFVLSQAIIPPQQITDGVVHLQVIEGYVAKVTVEGSVNDRRGLIKRLAEKIERSRPARLRDLERYVLLIGDLPGIEVNTVLRPSPDQPGASDLIVLVRREPLSVRAEADNRGSRAIGPEQFSGEIDANGVLGIDEQIAFEGATVAPTRELQFLSVRYDEILSAEGLRLSVSASASRAHPEGAIAPLNAFGRDQTYTIRLSEPVIRSRSHTLALGASLTELNSKTDLLGVLFSEDRLRIAAVDASYDFADTWAGDTLPATSLVRGAVSRGLDVLSATKTGSPNLSRANGRSDFTKLNIDVTRVQTMTPRWSVALAATGQASGDALLSSQQFGLGGARFGRGYEPSELTGDQGAAGSIEARYSPNAWPRLSPQLYGFYEAGIVWLNAPLPGERSGESLASAGLGFRFSLARHLTAEFEVAKPLTRDVASRGNRDARPLFAISTNF